ncbi:hypothetical protein [Hyphomicrobium sp.]|uniref:hypothetical protein n=1 Tax=Hyphomicrobium sp. TaxID=82 RepID=UPI002D793DC6|nr:hypothetical protein [Hyphomicrobium sp.]HET6390766.1 hypothetical protein [Hyphomicrobium sp.]
MEGRKKLLAIIERELRKERRRGIAGHAAYDLVRHAKLVRLLKEERQSLTAFELSLFGRHRSAGLAGGRVKICSPSQ